MDNSPRLPIFQEPLAPSELKSDAPIPILSLSRGCSFLEKIKNNVPGRTWGGAGQRHLASPILVLSPRLLAYAWRWSRCLGRCHRALLLPCSFLRPYRALPAPFPRLSGPPCLIPAYYYGLPPAFLPAPCPSPVPSPLASARPTFFLPEGAPSSSMIWSAIH